MTDDKTEAKIEVKIAREIKGKIIELSEGREVFIGQVAGRSRRRRNLMLYYGLIIGFILGVITSFWIFGKRLESLARCGIILPETKLSEKYKKDIHQRYFEEN